MFTPSTLKGFYVVRAGSLLTLTNFVLYLLAIIQCCVFTTGLNCGVMNKEIFASIFRCNKSKTLIGVKPLNGTFTHNKIF